MRPRPPLRFEARPEAVAAAAHRALGAVEGDDGLLRVGSPTAPDAHVELRVEPDGSGSLVVLHPHRGAPLPFFWWAIGPLVGIALRRWCDRAGPALTAALAGEPSPAAARPVAGLPNVAFDDGQAALLSTAAAAVALVGFTGALTGQLADPVADSFGASDARLGVVLAVTRAGALFSLFATALADRRGRRRIILVGVLGSGVACALSAVAPTLEVFGAAQTVQRAFFLTTATVAGIAAIEEAPEGARAYAASMLALAGGFGFSFAVVALVVSDLGEDAWRVAFGIGALAAFAFVPRIARHLGETRRYRAIVGRADITRGRVREVFDRRYARRFALLGLIGFLTNLLNAPSSQLMNKYLSDDRGFSGAEIAGFRALTTAVPGLVGLMIAGRIVEQRGRKPVAIVALLLSTAATMVFFVGTGPVLWVTSAVSVFTAAGAGIALGTLDAELFPTEVRGTSNALLMTIAVVGSAAGLVAAGMLSDPLGGLGRAIALCGIGSLLAAVVLVPRLPESVHRELDDVSPSLPSRPPPPEGDGPAAGGADGQ